MGTMQRLPRLSRELEMLKQDPPFGISCWPDSDRSDLLHAQVLGLAGTPYERGLFRLEVVVPDRYPFEPPAVRFVTPIYHPNIDSGGRICLDVLKMPPKGSWKPALNIGTILTSVQQLMAEPNPNDALMSDIAAQFTYRRSDFEAQASAETLKHATDVSLRTMPPTEDVNVSRHSDDPEPQVQLTKDANQATSSRSNECNLSILTVSCVGDSTKHTLEEEEESTERPLPADENADGDSVVQRKQLKIAKRRLL